MRKRTIREIWDYLFWGVIYLLPIVVYIIFMIKYPQFIESPTDLLFMFKQFLYGFVDSGNIFIQVIQNVLGVLYVWNENTGMQDSYIWFGYESVICIYLGYCATVALAHVFFDVIVFIPRLAHKWLGKATQQD